MFSSIMSKLKSILHNPTVSNAKWMIGEQLVQMVISLLLGVATARYLAPTNYGVINYCAAYVAFFTSVCTLGLEGIIIKEMVAHREEEGTIIGTGLVMRLAASALSIGLIQLILLIMNPGDTLRLVVAFLQSVVLLFRAFELLDFWFQSHLRSKYVAIIKSISYFLVAAYKVYILASGKSVEWFAFSTSLDFLLIAIMLPIAYFKKGGKALRFSFPMAKRLLGQSYHFILSGLIVTLYSQMDKIMIGQMLDDTQVGLYSAALTICNYWVLIPVAMINSARPTIMEAKSAGRQELYEKRIRRLYALLIWVGIAVSLVVSIASPLIIFILYGKAYAPAASALSIAIWYTTFSTLGTARGIWIVCEDKNTYVKKYVLWGALVNLVFNFLFIPLLGINGAALATLITQIFTCVLAPMLYKQTRDHTRLLVQAFLLKGIK